MPIPSEQLQGLVYSKSVVIIINNIDQLTIAKWGPPTYYTLLGNSVSLVCGTGLDSNPQATVTWTAPDGTMILMDDARYDLENGPEIVRLNFTNASLVDSGCWKCNITVISEQWVVDKGVLVMATSTVVGEPDVSSIQLTVVSE